MHEEVVSKTRLDSFRQTQAVLSLERRCPHLQVNSSLGRRFFTAPCSFITTQARSSRRPRCKLLHTSTSPCVDKSGRRFGTRKPPEEHWMWGIVAGEPILYARRVARWFWRREESQGSSPHVRVRQAIPGPQWDRAQIGRWPRAAGPGRVRG